MPKPHEFGLHLRIPTWTTGAAISINGKRQPMSLEPGAFAVIKRQWRTGDRVELELPMTTRLEAIDPQHSDIVALMYGPLVLFPITTTAPVVTRRQLLSASPAGSRSWRITSSAAPVTLLPFTEIGDEAYATYVRVS